MKLPCLLQPRILNVAIRSLLSRPYTTRFPEESYAPVESFRGRPRFDPESCIGCGACAEVCPSKCIEVVDDLQAKTPVRRLTQHLDACLWCGQCERYCPTGAGIRLTNEYDVVGFAPADFEEKVEKELVRCEVCGEIVGPADQLRWIARRLGALAFANPTAMMTVAKDLGLAGEAARSEKPVRRSERIGVQCARCRRETARAA
jgi:hydrogenase-4 component H